MTTHRHHRSAARPAFTMIEIAIALGVIAFALVAIIGVLPFGLNVQKESNQDTVISEDAPYFLNALRIGGIPRANVTNASLDFLTNYVESIAIFPNGRNGTPIYPPVNSGQAILGALTTPEYYLNAGGAVTQTNIVIAHVRSLSGSALEQNGANPLLAFRYLMSVEVVPIASSLDQTTYLQANLFDVHLKFSWPVVGVDASNNFSVGPGRANFRTMVSGQLQGYTNSPFIYWYMQPNTYSTNFSYP
jgi:hypothetical protein